MAGMLPDSDSEDELPPCWEERATLDGSVYYVNHLTRGTQWTHPRTSKKKFVSGDLPTGWERKIADDGKVTFVDKTNGRTTFTDPRLAFAKEEVEPNMELRQRFDGSSTALQVLHGCDLSGKVILVTGSTNGIGLETAKSLAAHGAEVIVSGRSEATCKEAMDAILNERPNAKLFTAPMELSSLASVKHGAAIIKRKYTHLDVVILNAGVIGMGWQMTEDKLESMFQINHLSQFYLTMLLEDTLQPGSRVVIVSSESHRQSNLKRGNMSEEKLSPSTASGYWDIMAYNNSKLCNVLFCLELHQRWGPRGVDVFSLHPGNLVSTGIAKRSCLYRFLFALVRPFTKSLQQAAATSVLCAVAPELTGRGGVYFNNCCMCQTTQQGRDAQMAGTLWDISMHMLARRVGPIVL